MMMMMMMMMMMVVVVAHALDEHDKHGGSSMLPLDHDATHVGEASRVISIMPHVS